MKHQKKTDRIIKNKMENYSMDAPMHLFEGIASALDGNPAPAELTKKSSRGGYWLFAMLVLLLAGGGIWYGTSKSNDLKDTSNPEISSTSTEKSSSDVTSNKLTNSVWETRDSETPKTVADKSSDQTIALKNTSSKNNQEKLTTKNESIVANTTNVQNSKINIETKQNTVVSERNSPDQPNVNFKSSIPNNELTEKGSGAMNTEVEQNSSSTQELNQSESLIISSIENTESKAQTRTTKKLELGKKKAADVLFLPTLKSSQRVTPPKSTFSMNAEPVCGIKPDGSKIKFTTSIDALFSLDFASQILEYKSEDFKDYAQRRTDTESPYYSFQTGIRVNFLTEFDWAVRTGIVYTQINEILKTEQNETRFTTDPVTGDTTDFYSGVRVVNRLNKYQLIDVPVIVGYEMAMKRFRLNLNGGVFVNLMSEQTGAINSLIEERVVYFTEGHPDDHDFFKKNIGFSTFMSLGFNFNLGNKTQLIIEPNIRYYPKSFTLKEYVLNQKYLSTGLMIGVRRDL